MKLFTHTWRYLIGDPLSWLYKYFFRPDEFFHTFDMKSAQERRRISLRLFPHIFLAAYLLAIFLVFVFYRGYVDWLSMLLPGIALGTFSGVIVAMAWDALADLPVTILGGPWLGMWLGMWAGLSLRWWAGLLLTTIGGITLGTAILKGTKKLTAQDVEEHIKSFDNLTFDFNEIGPIMEAFAELIGIGIYTLLDGFIPRIEAQIARRIGKPILRGILVSIITFFLLFIVAELIQIKPIKQIGGILWLLWWAITIGSLTGTLAGVTLHWIKNRTIDFAVGIGSGIVIGHMFGDIWLPTLSQIIISITPALTTTLAWTIGMYIGLKSTNKSNSLNILFLCTGLGLGAVAGHLAGGVTVIIIFLLCYITSYFQLAYRPISLYSIALLKYSHIEFDKKDVSLFSIFIYLLLILFKKSRTSNKLSSFFPHLWHSSLYWDVWGTFPIANLSSMLEIMARRDVKQTLEVISFIEMERPQHLKVTRAVLKTIFSRGPLKKEDVFAIFTYLRTSTLYWDEVYLPSQRLAPMIETAFGEDPERTLDMVAFIKAERPERLEAVQAGMQRSFLTSIAHEMEAQKTLRDISETVPRIVQLQSHEDMRDTPDLPELLASLKEICLDASYYINSLSWQSRYDALQHMLAKLKNIRNPGISDTRNTLPPPKNLRLSGQSDMPVRRVRSEPPSRLPIALLNVINRWESTAQHELDKLQQEPRKTEIIRNPYVVGQALQPGTSLFVGRQDLVQQLEQGLRLGSHRPTFFLNGERRMGKSSTLRQLPYLLDKRHFLPLFFDLQAPEMTSSIAAFLAVVAEKIAAALIATDTQVEVLEQNRLHEASEKNEPQVYYVFNEWLKNIERVLEQQDRIVLLSFDEFENLESVGSRYLDLQLLLNWFRSVIQNRPQLAILFSGGKSVSEMGQGTDSNWSGYFVNVQTFRVSFLRTMEARQLITQPVPDYPIGRIFGEGTVDEIIRVTGCHPFLVQAVCSNIVGILNTEGRELAHMEDVEIAVQQVLETWEDGYFQDLWMRTDAEQRRCLSVLNELEQGTMQQIAQKMYPAQQIARATQQALRHTLQTLLKRDLVQLDGECYQIATPIFSQWVERNS